MIRGFCNNYGRHGFAPLLKVVDGYVGDPLAQVARPLYTERRKGGDK